MGKLLNLLEIIIVNYNSTDYLLSCLRSVYNSLQGLPAKVFVQDNASEDDVDRANEMFPKVLLSKNSYNMGFSKAANNALKQSAAPYVVLLNPDTYVTPEGFFLSYFPPIQEFNAKDLTRTCFICQPACFVRRSAYEMVGGIDPTLQYTMDWDLWCRLSLAGAKFKYIHEALAAVRYYPETKTLSGGKRRYKEIYRIERKYGKKVLPLSCLGSYYYELTFKRKKMIAEQISFHLLSLLRRFKKRVYKMRDSRNGACETNYGFHRWEPVVEGRGTIHLPWYDKREWKRLCLQVEPNDKIYHITINDIYTYIVLAKEGLLFVEMPLVEGPYRKISIVCLTLHQWRLLGFSVELQQRAHSPQLAAGLASESKN